MVIWYFNVKVIAHVFLCRISGNFFCKFVRLVWDGQFVSLNTKVHTNNLSEMCYL